MFRRTIARIRKWWASQRKAPAGGPLSQPDSPGYHEAMVRSENARQQNQGGYGGFS